MGIGHILEVGHASLPTGILWASTQLPAVLVTKNAFDGYVGATTLFYSVTFVLQSAFFGSVLCIFKWAKTRLATMPAPQKKQEPNHATEPTPTSVTAPAAQEPRQP